MERGKREEGHESHEMPADFPSTQASVKTNSPSAGSRPQLRSVLWILTEIPGSQWPLGVSCSSAGFPRSGWKALFLLHKRSLWRILWRIHLKSSLRSFPMHPDTWNWVYLSKYEPDTKGLFLRKLSEKMIPEWRGKKKKKKIKADSICLESSGKIRTHLSVWRTQ